MGVLDNLKTSDDIATEKDSVGGGFLVDSGVYPVTIEVAYITKSSGGATCLNIHLKTKSALLKQAIYVTSGDAKGGHTYYVDKEGNKQGLPGFNQATAISLLTVGKQLAELNDPEEKVINIYDYDAKKELPTKVAMLSDLIGQEFNAGILRKVVDKNIKNDAGEWVAGGDTKEENELDKVFRARDNLTVAEIIAGETVGAFRETWEAKNTGVTKMAAKGVQGTSGVPMGTPTPGAPAESSGLFK